MTEQAELEARIEAIIRERSHGEIWNRAVVPRRTRRQVEADVAELRGGMRDPNYMDAFTALVRQGRIINSGERRDGCIVWITPDALK
jgi:hypothetical protein